LEGLECDVCSAKIKAADAILIATPEYNYSIPGVLKNTIDWALRPYEDNSFKDKPVALMSVSTRMIGGERARLHLLQCFVFTLTCFLYKGKCSRSF
jgi:chromate reductase